MRLILRGNPVTKKNSQRIITVGGHPRIIPSKAFKDYEASCLAQMSHVPPIRKAVNLRCTYYMATRRRVDLANLLEATQDILVKAEVLEDDNCLIVASVDGSRVCYDKEDPRVEVEITEVQHAEKADG